MAGFLTLATKKIRVVLDFSFFRVEPARTAAVVTTTAIVWFSGETPPEGAGRGFSAEPRMENYPNLGSSRISAGDWGFRRGNPADLVVLESRGRFVDFGSLKGLMCLGTSGEVGVPFGFLTER